MELRTGDYFDRFVGERLDHSIVLSGECALQRCGLTTYLSDGIQAWTLFTEISGIQNAIVSWYFNPFAANDMDTNPSQSHPNILIPTKERALVEYVMFHEYFDEGILIEGLKSYIYEKNGDTSRLYEEAEKFHLKEETLSYWIKEALEDENY